jgi:hypothetical protein
MCFSCIVDGMAISFIKDCGTSFSKAIGCGVVYKAQ